MGTFKCRTTTERAPRPAHASRSPSRAAFPPASTSRPLFCLSASTSRLLCAKPTAPAHLDEDATHGTHVPAKKSRLSPPTQKQLSAARVGQVGSRDLPLCFVWRARFNGRAKRHREIALVRSPRAGRRIRLLAVSQESARAPWAVAIRPRTGRGPNDARDFFLSNDKRAHGARIRSIMQVQKRRKT